MTTLHWSPPDIRGDILAAALRSGAAEPVVVHVRPEVYARIGPHPLCSDPTTGRGRDATGQPIRIPLVVDDHLPRAPGYEVHRVAPREPGGMRRGTRPPGGGDPDAADSGPSAPASCTVRSWALADRRASRSPEPRWLRAHRGNHRGDRPA